MEMGSVDVSDQLRVFIDNLRTGLSDTPESGGGVYYFGLLVYCSLIPIQAV